MNAILGGAPSTGSSLLRQMLNRHSEIYCGPETRLFAHPDLISAWSASKHLIERNKGFVPDIQLQRGFNLVGSEQHITDSQIHDLVAQCDSIRDFVVAYFAIPLAHYGKSIWAEKTPANAYGFETALAELDGVVVCHVIRHPLDVAASLLSRGHTPYEAVGRWLLNAVHALKVRDSNKYVEVRYEDLVTNPAAALKPLLTKLGLSYEGAMADTGNPEMHETDRLPGWTSSELDVPNTRSVGRFERLSQTDQDDLLQAMSAIQVRQGYAAGNSLSLRNAADVATATGYHIDLPASSQKAVKQLKSQRFVHSAKSLLRGHFFPIDKRPLQVSAESA